MALDVADACLLQLLDSFAEGELPISSALEEWRFRLRGGVDAEWLKDVKPKARYAANLALEFLRDEASRVWEKRGPALGFVLFVERIRTDPVCERLPKALCRFAFLGHNVQHLR
jgi:hypothetical protein